MTLPREPDICLPRISRRNVVALGAGALANAAMPGGLPAQAQGAPHKLRIGTAEITVISDGSFSLPMSFALSKIDPKVASAFLSSRGVATDAFEAQINVAVVKTPDALILVDCGGSTDFMPTLGGFAARLESAGFQPADVTHVIFTHAHADHLWCLIDPLDECQVAAQVGDEHRTRSRTDHFDRVAGARRDPDRHRGVGCHGRKRTQISLAAGSSELN